MPRSSTWMSQEVSKRLVRGLYPQYTWFKVCYYNPFTNHLLTSCDIQVATFPEAKRNLRHSGWKMIWSFRIAQYDGCYVNFTGYNFKFSHVVPAMMTESYINELWEATPKMVRTNETGCCSTLVTTSKIQVSCQILYHNLRLGKAKFLFPAWLICFYKWILLNS